MAEAAAAQPSVQLVVKAPNQQIDDQLIVCALNWTVLMLKQHLSCVYPSQPNVEDQKLIYSGQLLHNHLTLKDFLRQYDTETVHTLHLVCVQGLRDTYDPSPNKSTKVAAPLVDTASAIPHSPVSVPVLDTTTTDGLRHRTPHTVGFPMVAEPMMGMQAFSADVMAMPAQMAWMNQMYSQYMNVYYQQYMGQIQPPAPLDQRLPAASNPSTVEQPPVTPATSTAATNNAAVANNNNNINAPVEQVAAAGPAGGAAVPAAAAANVDRQPVPNLPGMVGAGAAVADDDADDQQGNGNRDWLDWTYSICRAAVLFVIIHYYSSVGRFAVVALVAALIYVHQMGWLDPRMRRAPVRPNRINLNARGAAPQPGQPDPANEEEPAQDNDRAVEEQHEIRELEMLMNHDMEEPLFNDRSSFVNTAWTIVATFFSSLLPERPEQAML